MIEDRPELLRFCGRIWRIDTQEEASFWVEAHAIEGSPASLDLSFWFDIDAARILVRRRRDAVEVLDTPDQVEWRVEHRARATLDEDGFQLQAVSDALGGTL